MVKTSATMHTPLILSLQVHNAIEFDKNNSSKCLNPSFHPKGMNKEYAVCCMFEIFFLDECQSAK